MSVPIAEIAKALVALGCPQGKCEEMAVQLDRRAHQLAATKNRTYDEAMEHLLRLMAAGWAAQSGSDRPKEANVPK